MRKTTTEGFVLRVIQYNEKQNIVHLYTKDYGRVAAMVQRNSKKRKTNYFQPLFHLSFEINFYEQKSIHRISQVQFILPYQQIPFVISKNTTAQFLAEVLSKVIVENEPDKSLYTFLSNALHLFDQEENNTNAFHVVFLVHLTRFLGFYPGKKDTSSVYFSPSEGTYVNQIRHDTIPQNISEPFDRLLQTSISEFNSLTFDRPTLQELLSRILEIYRIRLNVNQLNSFDVLKQVFNS